MEQAAWEVEAMQAAAHDLGERRLVARLRAGELAAMKELYGAYRKPIFGFLVRLARDRYVAEDLFQNTWVKVSKSAHRLREDTELRAWMFTVARNEFRSYQRWQMVDVTRLFLLHRDRPEPAAESNSGALPSLERALAELGASDREVLLLVCAEGMAQQEAAAVLGISHAALRQRLGRARGRLKDAMSKLEGERKP
jgi:RNA polymerase sigma-70 factor (ECF subfamily)